MKTIQIILAILIAALVSCNKNDELAGDTLFEQTGAWDCTLGESCQDVYEFDFKTGTNVSISVEDVTGKSVVRLAVYAPGMALGSANLLTNNTNEASCGGQDEAQAEPNFVIPSSGVYKIAVTRDWGTSAGFVGDYKVTVIADTPFQTLTQTVDDTDSKASGTECP